MRTLTNRRDFIKQSVRAGLALGVSSTILQDEAGAVEPFRRSGVARLELSLAAYSFRDYFNHKDSAKRITLFDFIDFCADHGCQGTELTSYYFPKPLTDDFLVKLKRHAFLRGIEISGSAVGNNFTRPPGKDRDREIKDVKDWIDHAALLGAPHIRVFAGPKPKEGDVAPAKKFCVECLEQCGDYAGTKGIFLGLENHGGIVSEPADILEIVQAVKSQWVGINLDTGNFETDDPYADLARCAPYAVNVQLKVEIKRRNASKEPSDIDRLARILRDANYQGYVALEYEAKEDPWQTIPGWLKKMKQAFA